MNGDRSVGTGERVVRGAAAGLIAGITASFAMDRFQAAVAALSPPKEGGESEPATKRAADGLARLAGAGPLPEADKPLAGQAVHYALGAGLGVAYGIAAEFRPEVTLGRGTVFGAGTALLLDEAAVPALGFGEAPWDTPPSTHAYALASHLVFGLVAELVRGQVASTINGRKA